MGDFLQRALLVVCLAGCPAPSTTPLVPSSCVVRDIPLETLGEADVPMQITIGLKDTCDAGTLTSTKVFTPDDAIVELFNPDGDLHPSTHSAPERKFEGFDANTLLTVSFTPDREGLWRVTARIEPMIGRTTQFFRVIPFRNNTAFRTISAGVFSETCRRFSQTEKGTVFCVGGGELVTEHGQRIAAQAAALTGNVLWVAPPPPYQDGYRRYEEVDAGFFTRTHGGVFPGYFRDMAATPDSLWRLSLMDAPGQSFEVSRLVAMPDGGLALADAQRLFDVSVDLLPRGIAVENGRVHITGFRGLATLEGTTWTTRKLPDFGREVMGVEPSTIWTTDGENLEVLYLADAGIHREALDLLGENPGGFTGEPHAIDPAVPLLPNGQLFPTQSALALIPELTDSGIVLTGYRARDAGYSMVSATKQHVYARSDDGGWLEVIDR